MVLSAGSRGHMGFSTEPGCRGLNVPQHTPEVPVLEVGSSGTYVSDIWRSGFRGIVRIQ